MPTNLGQAVTRLCLFSSFGAGSRGVKGEVETSPTHAAEAMGALGKRWPLALQLLELLRASLLKCDGISCLAPSVLGFGGFVFDLGVWGTGFWLVLLIWVGFDGVVGPRGLKATTWPCPVALELLSGRTP